MNMRSTLRWLLAAAVALPIVGALLVWVGMLLSAMGDAAAARALERLQLAAGILWLVSLVGLVVVLAIHALDERRG